MVNRDIEKMITGQYSIPLRKSSQRNMSTAEKISWMGWELVAANEDVDLREMPWVKSFKALPIGNYWKHAVNISGQRFH